MKTNKEYKKDAKKYIAKSRKVLCKILKTKCRGTDEISTMKFVIDFMLSPRGLTRTVAENGLADIYQLHDIQ